MTKIIKVQIRKGREYRTIKYHELNRGKILGDKLIVLDGKTYTTKEDLKYFPSVIHLREAVESY